MINPEQRVHHAWGQLKLRDKLIFLAYAAYAATICQISEDLMKRLVRGIFVLTVILYIVFFLIFADRLPREAFVGGVFLGAILGGMMILSLMPQHHNGNNHDHPDSPP